MSSPEALPLDAQSLQRAARSLLAFWAEAGIEPAHLPPVFAPVKAPAIAGPSPASPAIRAPANRPGRSATPAAPKTTAEWVADAQQLAQSATTLHDLADAIANFDGISLKQTATKCVFADGTPGAPVMVVGEAPGREEDLSGLPFVGPAGQLLDRALKSIGLARTENVYVSNIVNWRPPGNRAPSDHERLVSLPFIRRHIELAAPRLVILAGATAAQTLLETDTSISRLRGRKVMLTVTSQLAIAAFPTLHPSYLLRRPQEKPLVYADLLAVQAELARRA